MRTLGNAIDTSLVDLKGGTTGQILAKASNSDLDFTWSSDATGIQASIFDAKGDLIAASAADTAARLAVGTNNHTLYADSTASTGLSWGASPKSVLSTTGDILYASSANTLARLGIGSSGQYLSVSGGIPSWTTLSAGGMTELASGTLSGSSVSLTSISGSYYSLILTIDNPYLASSSGVLLLTINSVTTADNYRYQYTYNGTTTTALSTSLRTNMDLDTLAEGRNGAFWAEFPNYQMSRAKAVTWTYSSALGAIAVQGNGSCINTSAITSIQITKSAGGNFSGGTYKLWGVK
jgi:hypothetical protein